MGGPVYPAFKPGEKVAERIVHIDSPEVRGRYEKMMHDQADVLTARIEELEEQYRDADMERISLKRQVQAVNERLAYEASQRIPARTNPHVDELLAKSAKLTLELTNAHSVIRSLEQQIRERDEALASRVMELSCAPPAAIPQTEIRYEVRVVEKLHWKLAAAVASGAALIGGALGGALF